MSKTKQLSPMMSQYQSIKHGLPADALLLFRLGDFYELFFEDANIGAQILNVALTKRGTTPMCGIPFHAAGGYIGKILKAGRKVAICEQVEDAKPGKLVKREVSQILSPGTHFDERLLQAERNNYLAAAYPNKQSIGLACVDLTTGDFKVTELSSIAELYAELERLRPAEIVIPSEAAALKTNLEHTQSIISAYDDWTFAPETAQFTLRDHLNVAALDGFGLKDRVAATGAAGGALHYLKEHLRRDVKHLTRLSFYRSSDFLVLDATTLRNLEVLEPLNRGGSKAACLYGALNRTDTPMGGRLLRDWLSQPLASEQAVNRRQDVVQLFVGQSDVLEKLKACLADIKDLERTISRLSMGTGNARDLVALKVGLRQILPLKQLLVGLSDASQVRESDLEITVPKVEDSFGDLLADLNGRLHPLTDLVNLLSRAILDEPPLTIKEGGMICDEHDSALDELRSAGRNGKEWIAQLQKDEADRTGIASLKVRFNSVFGYFIEVTKSNLDKVPENYIRKQTIANGERYFTPELKEVEGKILGAEERSAKLEYELFVQIRETVIQHLEPIQQTAAALAELDVLASFAQTARLYNYCRPTLGGHGVMKICDGRHPVLDQALSEERFVPNDVELDERGRQIALITGPNMAGKSTYIRQVALLALMAHIGSFVPAASAQIDLLDRIFTRIGASDDLSRGQSTFMVEMTETANILNNATQRSLVILDEIGRGTSTFDGLSLAWSIVEYLHNQVGAKTLFATHYHELTELALKLKRVANYNVAVKEWNDRIIFLRKILEGGTDKSYGIQVARLAGVPDEVVSRAKKILNNLEESELTPEGNVRNKSRHRAERDKLKELEPSPQLDLFS